MAPKYKIAIIQLHPKPLQPEFNFNKAKTLITSAAQQGAHLAVLPEYHLTNWKPADPSFSSVCATSSATYLPLYQSLAASLKISIVPGSIVTPIPSETPSHEIYQQATTGDQARARETDGAVGLQNLCYFIGPDGSILHTYVKKNLWGAGEREHLASSAHAAHEAFDTPLGRVGLLLCWDLAFPEAFRELIADGAKLVIVPAFWTLNDCSPEGLALNPAAETLFLDTVVTARTFENTCAVVFVNAGGPPGKGYAGVSQVAVPFVGPLVRLGSAAEGMAVAEVDMQILEQAEANYQVRADLAREGWHYEYRHDRKDDKGKL